MASAFYVVFVVHVVSITQQILYKKKATMTIWTTIIRHKGTSERHKTCKRLHMPHTFFNVQYTLLLKKNA
jgi:hypothetical protein